MIDLAQYFIYDNQTFKAKGVVVYNFDESKSEDFVKEYIIPFRRAYVSDEQLEYELAESIFDTRQEAISTRLPEMAFMKSGEFAEILYFYIAQAFLASDANIIPVKWHWKENNNTPCHLSDIILMKCPDPQNPSPDDYMFMMEIKSGATPLSPKSSKSRMNEAVDGAVKDMTSRTGKLVAYLKTQYSRDKKADMARQVKRFAESEVVKSKRFYNAAILVDRDSLTTHINNLTAANVAIAKTYKIALIAIPMSSLKDTYEKFYSLAPNEK